MIIAKFAHCQFMIKPVRSKTMYVGSRSELAGVIAHPKEESVYMFVYVHACVHA